MSRKVLIQIRRGLEKDIGILAIGELGFCEDTKKLYIGTKTGNVLLVAAQTVGDMLKSIYDTNNDGKVDMAELADKVPWGGITQKPNTFTPSTHTHTKEQISNFPSSLPANGGNADTIDNKHSSDFTTRINLSGQLQKTDYRHSVIALCDLTNTNINASSYSVGTISFHRDNGLYGPTIINVGMEKLYNSTKSNCNIISIKKDNAIVQPCTFNYNGKKYGGLKIYIDPADHKIIEFNGATNFNIFGLDYYQENNNSILNKEINDSINTNDIVFVSNLYFNKKKIALKEQIPTKVSQLYNDIGYFNTLPTHNHDSNYIKKGSLTWNDLKGV